LRKFTFWIGAVVVTWILSVTQCTTIAAYTAMPDILLTNMIHALQFNKTVI